jgi:hypothetical protein
MVLSHINGRTGLRIHAKNAMENAGVDDAYAKMCSGRSIIIDDGLTAISSVDVGVAVRNIPCRSSSPKLTIRRQKNPCHPVSACRTQVSSSL